MWFSTRLCSLFLIYINDFHNTSAKFVFYLFADDTTLLYADKNLKSLEETIIGVGAGGARGAAAPPNFGQLRFFGQREKIWAKPVFKDVSMFI